MSLKDYFTHTGLDRHRTKKVSPWSRSKVICCGLVLTYSTVQYWIVQFRCRVLCGWTETRRYAGGILWDWKRLGLFWLPRRRFTKRLHSWHSTAHSAVCVWSELGCSVCDLWATWCCSKRFGLFRLPLELSRKDYVPTQQSAVGGQCCVCVIWARAFCVWFMGGVVLLEAVRPFPAATRPFTKRLCSDTAEHGRRTVLYVRTELGRSVCGLWATWCCSKRFGLFRLPRELSRNGYFLTGDFRCLFLSVWINAARYSQQMVLTQSHAGLMWITLAPFPGIVAIERLSKLIQFLVHWKNFHIPKGPCSKSSFLALILFQDWNNFVGQCWHLLSRGCFLINYWQCASSF